MTKPNRITIGGETYLAAILRIEDRREDEPNVGLPANLSVMYPADTAELSEDVKQNHFTLVYVPASIFAPGKGY